MMIVANASVTAAATVDADAPAGGVTRPPPKKEHFDGYPCCSSGAPAFLSPPQDLPLFRPQCAEDRLQGYAASLSLHLRARQDRAFAYHGCLRQEATGTGQGDQTGEVPRALALCNPLIFRSEKTARASVGCSKSRLGWDDLPNRIGGTARRW